MKPHMCALVLLYTLHLLHAEYLTATSSMNTTEAHNNSSSKVTCGENQEYCEDRQSCGQKNRQCNGCSFDQVKCPDGRCVWDFIYNMKGCSRYFQSLEYECPNGHCYMDMYDSTYVCPRCSYSQTTCPDELCAERGQNCTSCPEGQKRCANKDCIPKSKLCPKPCFYGQVYCKDEQVCRNNYQNCKCDSNYTPGSNGKCKYVHEKPPNDNTNDNTYDETFDDDSDWNAYSLFGLFAFAFCVPCCAAVCWKCKQKRKYENRQAMELQGTPAATQPAFHYAPSVPTSAAVPQPHAQYVPIVEPYVPTAESPFLEPSAPSIQTSAKPNIQTSVPDPPPPSYE